MCTKLLRCWVVFFCLSVVSLHSEQWYRVSETELLKLEALSETSERDRQNWLSQAGELRMTVQLLQKESKFLNAQLAEERETMKSLRQSFEQSASAQLQKASEYETEITRIATERDTAEKNVLKIKNQRNILFFILVAIAGSFSVVLFLKIRSFFFF